MGCRKNRTKTQALDRWNQRVESWCLPDLGELCLMGVCRNASLGRALTVVLNVSVLSVLDTWTL